MGVLRDGEMTQQSLAAAVADEHHRLGGPRPLSLLVSTPEMERAALRILDPNDLLSSLLAGLPFVEVTDGLAAGEWMLKVR